MRITDIETFVLLAPNYDPTQTSSGQDSFVVLVHTDAGITGTGDRMSIPGSPKPASKHQAHKR